MSSRVPCIASFSNRACHGGHEALTGATRVVRYLRPSAAPTANPPPTLLVALPFMPQQVLRVPLDSLGRRWGVRSGELVASLPPCTAREVTVTFMAVPEHAYVVVPHAGWVNGCVLTWEVWVHDCVHGSAYGRQRIRGGAACRMG